MVITPRSGKKRVEHDKLLAKLGVKSTEKRPFHK